MRWRGDVDGALSGAASTLKADYWVPHLAQTPMEPPAAVARFDNGKWEIWTPTQGPELAQHYIGLAMLEPDPVKGLLWLATEPEELRDCERPSQTAFNEALSKHLNVPVSKLFELRDQLKKTVRDNVKVHVTLLGGGFGRRVEVDVVMQAVMTAARIPDVPVQLIWSREEDVQHDVYRPMAAARLSAAMVSTV